MANSKKHKSKPSEGLLFHAVQSRRFGTSICFLCGRRLGTKNRADEHVISRWLQDRFCLWDHRLYLLNKTSIPYRQLKIPCCDECNNEHLAKFEASMREAVEKGADEVIAQDPLVPFIWLGKILYGLLYKEFFLHLERRNPTKGRIVSRSMLRRYGTHHLFLQAARAPLVFRDSFPASIFVFRTQASKDPRLQFDFCDSYDWLTISLRLGAVGMVAALQDGGAQRQIHAPDLERYRAIDFHPLQFAELTAMFFYKASLMNRVPKYMTIEASGRVVVCQPPLGGFTTAPLFDDWDQAAYARILSQFTGYPLQDIFRPPNQVASWLHNEKGEVRAMDLESNPWSRGLAR